MKKLFAILTATLTLTFALNANAKIGDTFVDPELGTITVKAPAFPDEDTEVFEAVNGKKQIKQTKQRQFIEKIIPIRRAIDTAVDKLNPNMSTQEIVATTKIFITNFQKLKELRKTFYQEYNGVMEIQYSATIKDGQRAFKYKFLDYFMKIKGTPEFDKLKEELNFSTQILNNLKLYQ